MPHLLTVRQALAHVSGMQREPLGDIWDTLDQPDARSLMEGFAEAERVGRPHTRWHYSNLAYAVLGQIVEKLDGRPWYDAAGGAAAAPPGDVAHDGRLRPTTSTSRATSSRRSTTCPGPSRSSRPKAMAAVGGLASTARDLARWSAFVAVPDPEILSPDTLEEMCQPQVLTDVDRWTTGMGLGFFVHRSALRPHLGGTRRRHARSHHRAAHPPRERHRRHRADEQHRVPRPDGARRSSWPTASSTTCRRRRSRGGRDVGARGAGRHHRPLVLRGPRLHLLGPRGPARGPQDGAPATRAPSVFVADGPDRYRTESGRERGELLRVTRDDTGRVERLHWATYLFTREPLGFGEHHAVPVAVDAEVPADADIFVPPSDETSS